MNNVGRGEDGTGARLTRYQTLGVVTGAALEYYDFSIYAFFAVQIGQTFFPGQSAFISLMLSLLTYGSGYLIRPLGAVVIGRLADRRGRRPAMIATFLIMGCSILGLALTPSYAVIGVAAPILVVMWRLCQGFAMGGESGPTMALLVEAAPPERRGEYGSWMYFSHGVGVLAGGLVGVAISVLGGAAFLDQWGWRVAFLLGAIVLPVGIILRRSLPETLHQRDERKPAVPAAGSARDSGIAGQIRLILLCSALSATMMVGSQILNFSTTYAVTTLHMPAGISLAAPIAVGLSYMAGTFASGRLSDRWGRKFFLLWPRLAFILLAVPAYWLIVRNRDAVTLFSCISVLTILLFLSATATIVAMTESLRREIRGTTGGTIVAISIALFSSSTQPIVAWLIHATGNPLAPAWYLVVFNILGLIAGLMMKESAPRRLALTPAQGAILAPS